MALDLALVRESPHVPGEGGAALHSGQGLSLLTFLKKGCKRRGRASGWGERSGPLLTPVVLCLGSGAQGIEEKQPS